MDENLQLLDWKRRVFELYASVRRFEDPIDGWELWVRARDELFRWHPQSPLPKASRADFRGLDYFDYDPTFRVTAVVRAQEHVSADVPASVSASLSFVRYATAEFQLRDTSMVLDAFWLPGYGGGLFVPFKDATSSSGTYGGGRYLLDTIKGADLGGGDDDLIFDFNFAYNPSCSYDPRWDCPLTPPSNHLPIAITAGEKRPP